MGLTTDFHIKTIYGFMLAMLIGWSGGIAWSAREHKQLSKEISDVRYDNGVRLASIETSLRQITLSVADIQLDIKALASSSRQARPVEAGNVQ